MTIATTPAELSTPQSRHDLPDREKARLDMLRSLQHRCWQIAEDHGFHQYGVTFGDRLMLIVSEAAEALESYREGHAPTDYWYGGSDGNKPEGIPSELADIVIRVFDLAEIHGIHLGAAILDKMQYNEGRPYLHGKTM
jgi:NTP pyrophosphatase (non-canonical NTP hydrolase)